MKILDLYIARSIIAGTLVAAFALSSLDMFFALAGELDDIGNGAYQIGDAFVFIMLTLPRRIYDYFPAAVLIGSLMSLGSLAANSELIAMRAAGVSVARIVRASVQAALVLMLVIGLIGEFIVPASENKAQQFRAQKMSAQVSMSESGIWIRDKNRYINIEELFPDDRIKNLSVYELDQDQKLKSILSAEAAIPQDDLNWVLHHVQRKNFKNAYIERKVAASEIIEGLIKPGLLNMLSVDPETMSARNLYSYMHYLQENKLDASHYQLVFWLKLVMPFSSVVMLLLALPFVFGFLRSASSGQLVMIGILLGLGFYILIRVASNIGQIYGLPPFLSATLPILVMMIVSLTALRRVH